MGVDPKKTALERLAEFGVEEQDCKAEAVENLFNPRKALNFLRKAKAVRKRYNELSRWIYEESFKLADDDGRLDERYSYMKHLMYADYVDAKLNAYAL